MAKCDDCNGTGKIPVKPEPGSEKEEVCKKCENGKVRYCSLTIDSCQVGYHTSHNTPDGDCHNKPMEKYCRNIVNCIHCKGTGKEPVNQEKGVDIPCKEFCIYHISNKGGCKGYKWAKKCGYREQLRRFFYSECIEEIGKEFNRRSPRDVYKIGLNEASNILIIKLEEKSG